MRNAYKILTGKPEGRNHLKDLGADMDNIKIDLREIRCEGVDCIYLNHVWDQCRAL
jgi:hypothetical protein